ncbi:hypothetical protein [[Mycoplasma] imitans]|uniref:hypothetical protein n=1 Tax=[Mycoplasma] imitans TaxID=29560 RepID=UPI000561AF4F|nr:hypothetical protein [[Mycoplasma] imitans]
MFACSFDFNAWKTWEYQRKYSAFDFLFNFICLTLFGVFASFPWILKKPDGAPNIGLTSPIFWIGIITSILFGAIVIINYVFAIINLNKINNEYLKVKRINIRENSRIRALFRAIQYAWPIFFIYISFNKKLKEDYLNLLIWSVLRAEHVFIMQIEEKYMVKNNPKKKYLEIKAQNIRTSDIINDIRKEFKRIGVVAEIDQVRFYRLPGKRSRNHLVVYNPNQAKAKSFHNQTRYLPGRVYQNNIKPKNNVPYQQNNNIPPNPKNMGGIPPSRQAPFPPSDFSKPRNVYPFKERE